jgi:hypothetical protein
LEVIDNQSLADREARRLLTELHSWIGSSNHSEIRRVIEDLNRTKIHCSLLLWSLIDAEIDKALNPSKATTVTYKLRAYTIPKNRRC